MQFNRYIENITPSKSMQMSMLAKELKKADPEILDLSIGEPDFDTPRKVVDEAIKWLNAGFTHYTTGPGLPELREGIAKKLNEENGCHYDPAGIIVCPSGKNSIFLACATLLNTGDEAVVLAPYWVSYPSIIESLGAVPVTLELKPENRYAILEEELRKVVSDRTRMIIINYPNNPTGMVLTENDLQALKNVMLDYPEITLLSDEMYEMILFDGKKNVSPAADPEIADRVITSNGFSKSAAMTGWRIGYIASTPEFVKVAGKFFGHTVTQTCGFIQKAAVVALTCKEEMEMMRASYEKRRNLFVDGMNQIPGVNAMMPDGAFYAWVNFDMELIKKMPGYEPGKGEYSSIVSEWLLRSAKVSSVPGIAYGVTGSTFVRFCFAVSEEALTKAVAQIRSAVCAIGGGV